jgi:hypothetical protein
MLSFRRVSSTLVITAVLTIFMTSSLVHAQSGTLAVACDATFGNDAATVFANVNKAIAGGGLQASDYAQIGVAISNIRQQYEDMTATAGCETSRQQIAQVSALDEDVMILNLLARLDTKNTAYSDFVQNTWKPRFDAFRTSLTATAAADGGTGSTSASGVCADTAYQAQIPADLKTLPSPDSTSAASIGSTLLATLKLRYQYEDATAPAGCDTARKDMVKLMSASEDILLAGAGLLADTANAAKYNDFMNKTVNPRGQKLYMTMLTDLGTAPATPAATAAS